MHMVSGELTPSPNQSQLAIICMPGQPPTKPTWQLFALRDATFSTKKRERDATF